MGDSRAILCRNGVAKRLTFDHSLEAKNNPIRDEELERIERSGGKVIQSNDELRIQGGDISINMTRALGDVEMKKYGISPLPSSMDDLPCNDPAYARIRRISHSRDAFLTIFTDGVSSVLSAKEIVRTINSRATSGESVRYLNETALHLGSQDNCTAIVVPLGAWGKYREPSSSVRYTRTFIGNRG